ncbi:MAG TPA: winged helix DNA-binding domain-containing protein [Anaerolineae bacterium]|nr:winged helix DNA-binding domain-containing protein [Anaerolineae bacterium]
MTNLEIIHRRLNNQHLAGAAFEKPEVVVAWQGAVQAQDYAGAKWAVGQRVQGADDAAVEQAFTAGAILRTHVMRPTWHFVAPQDIRWLLALTAPRVHAVNAYMYRQLELDDTLFRRSNTAIAQALEGDQYLTRAELGAVLAQAGIVAEGMRLGYILHRAELDAVVCSGPRRGKQFTYALLDERAPQAKTLERDEALAELTKRYFTSHGPAMVQDFAWWSGLTLADGREGLDMVKDVLIQETVGDQTYWLSPDRPVVKAPSPSAYLLPNYDEYLISYRDNRPAFEPEYAQLFMLRNVAFSHFVVLDGRVIGSWKRTFQKKTVVISLRLFEPLSEAQSQAIRAAAERYGSFLGMPATLVDDPLSTNFDS